MSFLRARNHRAVTELQHRWCDAVHAAPSRLAGTCDAACKQVALLVWTAFIATGSTGDLHVQQPLARSAMHRKSIVLRTLTLRVHGNRLSLAGTAAALAHVLLLVSTSR